MADQIKLSGIGIEALGAETSEARLSSVAVEVLYDIRDRIKLYDCAIEVLYYREEEPETSGLEVFPLELGRGASGGPRFGTEVLERRDGGEIRNRMLARPLWEYDLATGLRDPEDWDTLRRFIMSLSGPLTPFLLSWPIDDRVEDQPLPRDPTATTGTVYQAVKDYTAAGRTHRRPLTDLVIGTVVIEVDGTPAEIGTDCTIHYGTGRITFSAVHDPSVVVTLTAEYYHRVRLSDRSAGMILSGALLPEIDTLGAIGVQSVQLALAPIPATPSTDTIPAGDWGAGFGAEFSVQIEGMPSGWERRQLLRAGKSRGQMSLTYQLQDLAQLRELLAWFLTHHGRAYPFRAKDWTDFQAQGEPLTGAGTTWQLVKRYQSAAGTHTRTITHPRADTLVLRAGESVLQDGVDYTLDGETGVVTTAVEYQTAPEADFEFDTLTRFDQDDLALSLDYCEIGSTNIELREVDA